MRYDEHDSRTDSMKERLDALLRAYRDAVPDQEPGAQFMPRLWERIEAQRSASLSFRHLAQRFVTACAAICLFLGVLLIVPSAPPSVFSTGTYLDVLIADLGPERSAYAEVYRGEVAGDEGL